MNPNQIKQLEKLAKVFNTENVISPEDIAQVVKGIAEIVKTERENVKNLSEEHKQLLQSVINTVSDEHDKVLASIENTSQKAVSDATEASTKAIEEMKRLCNEIMLMKPENGKDADEEYIIERVLSEIKLPEYKETVLDNAEQIKDKLSSLEGEKRLDISAIKGAEKFSTQANLDRAISILDQRTQFLINKTNTSTSGGGGTWGSITGTLSDQTDLQTALNAKQATLVSGTNIKTINGASLLGSGDISISGVGTGTANTIAYWDTTTSIASLATASYPSLTEISYVKGVTSAIQTQLDAKVPYTGATADLNLGTWDILTDTAKASTSAGLAIQSSAGTVTALFGAGGGANSTFYGGSKFDYATATTVPYFDGTKNLVSSAVTPTELGYVSGVTSAIQTQLNAKQASGNYITALTGDVTASGPGSVSATIANDAVTYAKIQNVSAASKLLGRGSAGGAGDVEEITLGTGLSMSGTTLNASGTPLTLQTNSVANGSQTLLNLVAGTNVTLTDNGTGSVTIDAAGGGGTPAGSSLTVQYNNAGAFGGMSGTSWDDTNRALTITGATVTTSKPILDLTQTWNAGAVTFTGLKLNVTNTASAAASNFFDFQVGGSTVLSGQKNGTIKMNGTWLFSAGSGAMKVGNGQDTSPDGSFTAGRFVTGGNTIAMDDLGFAGLGLASTYKIFWSSTGAWSGTGDLYLYRDAAGVLAQRNSTNSQSHRVYKTYTDASNYERLALNGTATANWLQLAAETAGTGGDNLNLAITPSGTGANTAQVADSGTGGGNARGTYATDWQKSRGDAAHVASGNTSTLSGGRNNTSSGVDGWIPGGNYGTTRGLIGAYAYANGRFAADGDAQIIGQIVRKATTNATPAVLTADAGAASATNIMVLPNNSVYGFTAKVWAISGSNAGYWEVCGTMYRGANAAATALIGTTTITAFGVSAALSTAVVDVIADTTNGGAVIQVTGIAATNINWGGELSGGQGI